MNPLTQTRNITKLNEREISLGIKQNSSWHNEYKDSAWIFVGGLSYDLTEGDVISVLSQYGEIVNINLVRDKATGKSKGFCFICYEDQRSTILAVDNLNGMKLCSRTVRVDHVAKYRIPKDGDDVDEETQKLREEGCAPVVAMKEQSAQSTKKRKSEDDQKGEMEKRRKKEIVHVKTEPKDPGYDKYEIGNKSRHSKKKFCADTMQDQSQSTNRSEKDTSGRKHKKSKHSSKESRKSQKHHVESDEDKNVVKYESRRRHHTEPEDDKKKHKHKSRPKNRTESEDDENTHKPKSRPKHDSESEEDENAHKHKSRKTHSKHRH